MGTAAGPRYILEWQASLGGMLKHGARVVMRCRACDLWEPVDVAALAAREGDEATLWNAHPPCPDCGAPVKFHASAGAGTPLRPLFNA